MATWFAEEPPADAPQLNGKAIEWKHIANYYDGPISGLVSVPNGEFIAGEAVYVQHWAECFEEASWLENEPQPDWYRRYKVYKLTRECAQEEARRRRLWEKYVSPEQGKYWPKEEWSKFYDLQATWPEWKPEGKIIGWFEQ